MSLSSVLRCFPNCVRVQTEGQEVKLTESDGTDILGNIVEASALSLNPGLYGSLHNFGHYAIACINDPSNRYSVGSLT